MQWRNRSIVAWLRVVAIHEAYRLSGVEPREACLERFAAEGCDRAEILSDPRVVEQALEAREALRPISSLPKRQRDDLALLVAGYSYREISEMTGWRTYTNVITSLVRALHRTHEVEPVACTRGADRASS
jgi:DNA-directed RNA polymerase specialized sigma24 family protein